MPSFPKSKFLMSLFASASKSGGTYFSTTYKGTAPLVIEPGQRITLVKSNKVASNGSEIWSLLSDEPGTQDGERVHEDTGNALSQPRRQSEPSGRKNFDRDLDDSIPF